MSKTFPPLEDVSSAAKAVGVAMGGGPYAIIGGAACALLGSSRATSDVDFVVPKGQVREARSALRKSTDFTVQPKTFHTHFHSPVPVDIDILAPPALFKEQFDEDTPIIMIDGVRILKPVLILNAKCRSVLSRATEEKKRTDKVDIFFLLEYLVLHDLKPMADDVPNASKEFVDWLNEGQVDRIEKWTAAGYNFETGKLSSKP